MVDQTSAYAAKPEFKLGHVLGRAFSGVFSNFKPILLVLAITSLIGFVGSLSILSLDDTSPGALMTTAQGIGIAIFTSVLGWLLVMFVCIFTDVMAFASFRNNKISFKDAARRAAKATLPLLLIVILAFLAIYLGMLLLLVPAMILSAGWAVLGPTYLHEDTPLFGAFGRSWELTSGYKWWVLLAQIIMALILIIIFAVTLGLQAGLTGVNMYNPESVTQPATFSTLLITSITSIGMYLAYCMNASFVSALYVELREIKEGLSAEGATVFD